MPIYKTKNEDFFKEWSSTMAYVLGFFAADGNLTRGKRNNHFIEFTSCDRHLLSEIRNALSSNHKISQRAAKRGCRRAFRLQLGSKEMFSDLIRLGFTPRKSLVLQYPSVPEGLFPDFVRGYFDGDGHVTTGFYKRKNRRTRNHILFSGFTSGTRSFLECLHKDLRKKTAMRGGALYYQKGWRLNFSNTDSIQLYKFLYTGIDTGLYLARKKRVFEKYLASAGVA
ncbi:MAG: hypothetical protein HYT14_01510 [Candidatus Liptonbacteria bacterium]|nr:hypothetical protein [Candidatus Liptonbacteria bacterium]